MDFNDIARLPANDPVKSPDPDAAAKIARLVQGAIADGGSVVAFESFAGDVYTRKSERLTHTFDAPRNSSWSYGQEVYLEIRLVLSTDGRMSPEIREGLEEIRRDQTDHVIEKLRKGLAHQMAQAELAAQRVADTQAQIARLTTS